MTIQECLSRNIKFYRKQKNLTQSQLAEKSNTSTNYIATIEIGKKYPSADTLEKIAKTLEIYAIDLFQIETKNCSTSLSHELEIIKLNLKVEMENLIDDVIKI